MNSKNYRKETYNHNGENFMLELFKPRIDILKLATLSTSKKILNIIALWILYTFLALLFGIVIGFLITYNYLQPDKWNKRFNFENKTREGFKKVHQYIFYNLNNIWININRNFINNLTFKSIDCKIEGIIIIR